MSDSAERKRRKKKKGKGKRKHRQDDSNPNTQGKRTFESDGEEEDGVAPMTPE